MTTLLRDAFDIPEDPGALGFVVQIRGGSKSPQELVDEYILTPGVQRQLPDIFENLRTRMHQRNDDTGWFVHGSFGAGKSHFMAVLAALLENQDYAWGKDDAAIQTLAHKHRPWLAERPLLVVRENLLSAAAEGSRFDRLIYGALNKTLAERGLPPFEFLNLDTVLDEARREADQYGDLFWRNMAQAGILPNQAAFEAQAAGGPDERELLAREYLRFKGRDPATAGFSPAWADGLQRMARHAKDLGFGGLVFLVDEMLLWLSGLAENEYKEAINQLLVMVDHTDGVRAVPMGVFVARQRRFSELFPDLVDEEQLHEHLDHHKGRFETFTLEDVELRYICQRRVLRRTNPAAVEAALERIVATQRNALPAVLQNADEQYLRDVYPFHPALIESLIDISTLLQRDRTALRLLTELLAEHRDLPLDTFIPVGSAFDAVFIGTDFTGTRKADTLRAIQRVYQQRLAPAIEALAHERAGEGFSADRRQALEQVVRSALLAEASPRLKGPTRITVERLVRLNEFYVVGETDRGRMSTIANDLVALSAKAPAMQLTGSGANMTVGVAIGGVDIGEILERAKGQVENPARRFRTLYGVLKPMLGLAGRPGFGAHDGNDGPFEITWRSTRRRGTVCIANVRELSYDRFAVREGDFRVIVDYPWDELGHQVEEDRQRALTYRKAEGSTYTVVWLPRHFNEREMQLLLDLAAAEFVVSDEGREKLLGSLAVADRDRVVQQSLDRVRTLTAEMERVLRGAYKDHGEMLALTSDVSGDVPRPELKDNLAYFAIELLDRRYPQHPKFAAEPVASELRLLLDWMVAAGETGDHRAPFDDKTQRVLRDLGLPLELVDLGQRQGRLRLDTRYIAEVLDRFNAAALLWAPVDEHLEETYGFQAAVRNLFLVFASRHLSYRAVREQDGAPVDDLTVDGRPRSGLRLERAPVLALAEWSQARALGRSLFGLPEPQATPTLTGQDEWAGQIRRAGHASRTSLQRLHEVLAPHVARDATRLEEIREAIRRLVPVDKPAIDSFNLLRELLQLWPADEGDPLREVVSRAEQSLRAAQALDRNVVANLEASRAQPEHPGDVDMLLDRLAKTLGDEQLRTPLTETEIQRWNESARELVQKLIVQQPPESQPPSAPQLPGVARHDVWQRRSVDAGNQAAIRAATEQLARTIEELAPDGGQVEVDCTVWVTGEQQE